MIYQFNNHLTSKGITTTLSNYSYSFTNPLQWQNGHFVYNNDLKFISQRDVIHTQLCKFMEKVTFNAIGTNFAIAIGYNPATNSAVSIDKSNYLISTYLKNQNYDGYYLLNMFPDVTPVKIKRTRSTHPDYIDVVLDFLNKYPQINQFDIFIFWGSSVYIPTDMIQALLILQKNSRSLFTFGVGNTHHQHPRRGVSTTTINHNLANIGLLGKNSHFLK